MHQNHVVVPGLINGHHHFFQTLTRAHPDGINKELFHWLQALYPVWARHVTPENLSPGDAARPDRTSHVGVHLRVPIITTSIRPASTTPWTYRPRKPQASACA